MSGDFECAGVRDEVAVVNEIFDGAESIAGGVFDLGDGVLIRALDEDGAGGGVAAALDESVVIVAQGVLVHILRPAQILLGELVDGIDRLSSSGKEERSMFLRLARFSSLKRRSLWASFSRSVAWAKKKPELTSVFSYSKETLQVRM